MELISNKKLDLKEYLGHIVVMHENVKSEKVELLKEVLDASGYQYFCLPVSNKEFDSAVNFEETNILSGCVCLIPVFSKSFFENENTYLKSQYWYYIGYVKATYKNAILPFYLDDTKSASLNNTPLHKLDFKNNVNDLLSTIQEKFSSKLLCYNYYENKNINRFASKRILYRDFCIKFKIYQASFDNAKDYYQSFSSRHISDNAFDELLAKNLLGGCRVLSFGNAQSLIPPLMPYKDEVYTLVADYPKIIVGKKSYVKLSENEMRETGVRAELTMDILMPIHKLLGTNFKCFITSKNQTLPIYLIALLFEGDFAQNITPFIDNTVESKAFWIDKYPKETFIDEENNRLYFSVGLSTNDNADESLGVGKYADYTYPQ